MRSLGGFDSSRNIAYAPDEEGGADVSDQDTVDTGDAGADSVADAGGADDPGPEGDQEGAEKKQLSVRDEIKKAMADSAEKDQPEKPEKEAKAKKPVKDAQKPVAPQAVAAPERLSKEAKAAWGQTPEPVKTAFLKAEQDMQKGVDELKQKYSLIDQALAPHTESIRQMNATPGEAVDRLFLWFKALAGQPVEAVPRLIQAMGYDWNKVVTAIAANQGQGQLQQGQEQPQQQGGQQVPEIPDPVRNYIGSLEQQLNSLKQQMGQVSSGFGQMQQDVQAQNEQKARENLSIWSSGKEFFDEVRQDMAQLLQTGMVPLKDGKVDLDTAYERAIYFNPGVREKVLAKQQQANQQVQQDAAGQVTAARQNQVAKARKASVSLPASSTPGAANGALQQKPLKGQTVRDSLKQSIQQLRDQ